MNYTIKPGKLHGTIDIPSSKSQTHRALIFALLARGTSKIYKYLDSPDSAAMLRAIKAFGATVIQAKDVLEITGIASCLSPPKTQIIDAGNSGIVLRFIGALSALTPAYTIITGDHSLCTHRPVKPLLKALNQVGAFAKSVNGNDHAPIIVGGPFRGGSMSVDGQDSQPISALLIASSFAARKTNIYVTNPGEKPWIDLTLSWFDFLKLPYKNHGYTHYTIPGSSSYAGFDYTVPGDLSSLAFPVAAALITKSEIVIKNVAKNDMQGDKKLFDALSKMGANLVFEDDTLHVKKGGDLRGCAFDINDYIDAITILAVVGCYAKGTTVLVNAAVARKKECDRIRAIVTELKKMGADIEERKDGLVVRFSKLKGAVVNTYCDHRMVMSLSVAALGAKGDSIIQNVQCVTKTYPNFKEHMIRLGAKLS